MNRQRQVRRDKLSQRRRRRRGLALLLALGAAGTIGTAFTASIALPSSAADAETHPWPTFTASGVTFDDPTTPTTVTFTITPTAAQARARTGGTGWSACTATATPDQWTCPVSGGPTGFEFVATP